MELRLQGLPTQNGSRIVLSALDPHSGDELARCELEGVEPGRSYRVHVVAPSSKVVVKSLLLKRKSNLMLY